MTHRERVVNAMLHREGDRVPKGETWIEGSLANKLLGKTYPLDYQHFERDREIRSFLNMDLINLGDWPSEEIGIDSKGNRKFRSLYGYEFIDNGKSKHVTKPPIDDIEEANKYRMPDIRKVSGKIISDFKKDTDLFVMGQIGGPVRACKEITCSMNFKKQRPNPPFFFEKEQVISLLRLSMLDEMFPMEDYLVYCLTNTREMKAIAEKVMEFELQKAKLFIDCGADAIFFADDIAFNAGTFLPPHIMKEIVYPFYKRTVAEIKKYSPVPVIFHSDGDLNEVMNHIVEAGFDGIQSLQPSAGMDIAHIKKEYGDVLCLMGNIDLDYVMTFATPMEVEEIVKRTIDIAAPGGGFILSTCNSLVGAIPPENAIAMYRTAFL